MENVKQNTMKYKILLIFSFLLLTLLLFNTNVFASFDFEYNGTNYSLPDLPVVSGKDYYIIYTASGGTLKGSTVIMFFDSNQFIYGLNHPHSFTPSIDINTTLYKHYNNSWEFIENSTYIAGLNYGPSLDYYLYSSFDILDSSGNVVFQAPVPEEATLAQVLVKTQEKEPAIVLKEVILILPLIIVIVVSLVGLRKALRMLLTLLHRA